MIFLNFNKNQSNWKTLILERRCILIQAFRFPGCLDVFPSFVMQTPLPHYGSSHIYLSSVVRRVEHAVAWIIPANLAHYGVSDQHLLRLPCFTQRRVLLSSYV